MITVLHGGVLCGELLCGEVLSGEVLLPLLVGSQVGGGEKDFCPFYWDTKVVVKEEDSYLS